MIEAAALLVAVLFAVGCETTVDVPEGVFACTTDEDCPPRFECRVDRCFAEPEVGEDGAVDAADAGGG